MFCQPCSHSLVDGVMTYEMTRFVIDAHKAVVHKAQPDQKVGMGRCGRSCWALAGPA